MEESAVDACLALLAAQVARLILAAVEDGVSAGSSGSVLVLEPVSVPSSTPPGRLAFLVISELLRLRNSWPDPLHPPFLYVLAAKSKASANFLASIDPLHRFSRQDLLDVTTLDLDNLHRESEVKFILPRVRRTVSSHRPWVGSLLTLFAQGLDSLRMDGFRVSEGDLQQGMETSKDMGKNWRFCEVAPDTPLFEGVRHGIEDLGYIMDEYCADFFAGDAAFTVSTGAIIALGRLRDFCTDNVAAFICSPGVVDAAQFKAKRVPQPGVNFHALQKIAQQRWHGTIFQTPKHRKTISNYILIPSRPSCRPLAAQLAVQWLDTALRLDFEAFRALEAAMLRCCAQGAIELGPLLAVLRLSNYDPQVFYRMRKSIINQAPFATERQAHDLVQDVAAVRARCYLTPQQTYNFSSSVATAPLGQSLSPQPVQDASFEIGRVLMALRRYALAIEAFEASRVHVGDHAATLYNIGVCAYYSSNYELAATSLQHSLNLNPSQPGASAWRMRALARLDEVSADD